MIRLFIENKRFSVSDAFQRSRDDIGYPAPEYVASQLTSRSHPLHSHIQREMYFHPTKPFLFWGTRFVIQQLLKRGDAVAIWTDEYAQRVDSSQIQKLQKHGDLSFVLGENKENVISHLFDYARSQDASEMVVVDNQLSKLQAVQAYAEEYPDISLRLLLVGKKGRRNRQSPDITEIPNVRRTRRIAKGMSSERKLWVFDFNDTLLDRVAFELSLERRVISLVRRSGK